MHEEETQAGGLPNVEVAAVPPLQGATLLRRGAGAVVLSAGGFIPANLEPRFAMEVRDIIREPPQSDRYEKLKSELIRRLSSSQEQKTRRLLEHEELGDRKPSQFLRHLQGLAGSHVSESLVRSLWIGRLPNHIQAILAGQSQSSLDTITDLADSIYEIDFRKHVLETSIPCSFQSMVEELRNEITYLRREVAAVISSRENSNRSARTGRNRSRSRSRTEQQKLQDNGNCWYHARFGEKASKCIKPCSYKAGNGQSHR
ncbi:uncharacterized protein LOC117169993 [Belonocnema kinseyi]|uniref:uncharacterized protein LOC117169993 n=1 Tax=Belonocnema kinseyi TaxID=2817044 RepID=UPI00143E03A2|nr:uncharacterized protein LOC117169993 [Belonocnema kinseyi]